MSEKKIIVQKYGGTSVGTPEAIRHVAHKVAEAHRRGDSLVVVVSAMGGKTDELVDLAAVVSKDPSRRELDMLLATGEHVSAAVVALALQAEGVPAIALTGAQCGIVTNAEHTNARILRIRAGRVKAELEAGKVVVAAGFQGVGVHGELTTLGRGGSDTSAVALAAALEADRCEIYTDVEGVFSADPRLVKDAQPIPSLTHGDMQEMAWHGARVLKAEAVEFARDNGIDVEVLSTFGGSHSTTVETPEEGEEPWESKRRAVAGVSGRKDLVRLSASPAASAEQLEQLVDGVGKYDLVFGRITGSRPPWHLYLATEEIPDLEAFTSETANRFPGAVEISGLLGAVSLVGFGIGSRPRSLLETASVLERSGIEVEDCWTGRRSLSFVVPVDQVDRGVLALHRIFVTEALQSPRAQQGTWSSISA